MEWSICYLGKRGKEALTHRASTGRLIFETLTRARYIYYSHRYDSMTDPYKPVFVNPSSVDTFNLYLDDELGLGRIVGGNWDNAETRPLEDFHIYSGLYQRFKKGWSWEDTDYVGFARKKFKNGGKVDGFNDIDQFINIRCGYVDKLYDSIRINGYRPNKRGKHNVPNISVKAGRARHIHELEPLIVIDSDGGIHLRDGFHRVTIAKLLDIAEIPVLVLGRHVQWQHSREEYLHSQHDNEGYCRAESSDVHPDLRYL